MFNNTSELMSQTSAADGAVSGKRASGKRGSRGPRYDDKTLSEVVRELLPTYSEEWKMVAKEYHSLSLEVEERDHSSLRRHFYEKLCDKFRKPTGTSSKSEEVKRNQEAVELLVLRQDGDVLRIPWILGI